MNYNKNILQDLLVGIIITIISVTLGYWVEIRTQKPVIEIDYSRVYANINDTRIGYIFVGNSGKTTEKNISITIDVPVEKTKISAPELTSNFNVDYAGDETTITLASLRPSEEIKIFFTPKTSDNYEYFNITKILSDSGNIYTLQYVEWWNVSFEIKVIFIFAILLSFFMGFYITYRIKKKPKKEIGTTVA